MFLDGSDIHHRLVLEGCQYCKVDEVSFSPGNLASCLLLLSHSLQDPIRSWYFQKLLDARVVYGIPEADMCHLVLDSVKENSWKETMSEKTDCLFTALVM